MPVKINGATSGSVTLAAPTTGSDVTVTLPGTTGTLLNTPGAWTAYTPTFGGFTLGDGTISGRYCQIGKFVAFEALMTFGSTSAAASDFPTFTLPVTRYSGSMAFSATASFRDTSPGYFYTATPFAINGTTVRICLPSGGTAGSVGIPSTTSPFTWAVGDSIALAGTYEAA